jgi:hypothetical protein
MTNLSPTIGIVDTKLSITVAPQYEHLTPW